jgi:uncharacterized protein (TIGR00725 family)
MEKLEIKFTKLCFSFKMKILVIGTWHEEKAIIAKKEAEEIGKILAERGHTLITGAGTGISSLVVSSYKKHKGKKYLAYLPSKKEIERVGEELGPTPDEAIQTELDYPERNLLMLKNCNGIIALHGGLGTFTEIINGFMDYKKKVSVIEKGEISNWIKLIPEIKKKVFITKSCKKAIEYLEKH